MHGEMRDAYKILVGEAEGKRHKYPGMHWRII
jgi:hypothetical protein